MSITLTESAAQRVKSYLVAQPAGLGLRLAVKKTGCSGFAYVVKVAEDRATGDHVFESCGVRIFVDPESLPLVDGTEVDFVRQGLNEAFRFRNPNIKGECGCGESFTV